MSHLFKRVIPSVLRSSRIRGSSAATNRPSFAPGAASVIMPSRTSKHIDAWFSTGAPNAESVDIVEDPQNWPPHNKNIAYDWSLPTNDIYRDDANDSTRSGVTEGFAKRFESARQHLDYSYHSKLILRRQFLQDGILKRVIEEEPEQESKEDEVPAVDPSSRGKTPWIIFTAGAMGSGKGYVLTQLQKRNLIDLSGFIKVDPDMLKQELPEMPGYLNYNRSSAATKLHRESTQMADVIIEHALLQKAPILVDGSLRDVKYYRQFFERLRDELGYRIAIIHVVANRDVIEERVKRRAEKSGRDVPTDLLNESIQQVPESVRTLAPLTDAVFEISNNEGEPLQLIKICMNGSDSECIDNPTWDEFERSWRAHDGEEDNKNENGESTSPITEKEIPVVVVDMKGSFDDSDAHDAANAIWLKSYPNFCARCALSCDGQCGVCIHGIHMCACTICNEASLCRAPA